jgi:putative transposase
MHSERFGVEPIRETLGVSASVYHRRATGQRSDRVVEDERLLGGISELHAANYCAYGSRRMWKALLLSGEQCGRSRVERLKHRSGIQGAKRRGKPWRTTRPDPAALRSPDRIKRDFTDVLSTVTAKERRLRHCTDQTSLLRTIWQRASA